jgi:hypothetical protein
MAHDLIHMIVHRLIAPIGAKAFRFQCASDGLGGEWPRGVGAQK